MSKFKIGDKVMVVSRFKDSWYGEEHFNLFLLSKKFIEHTVHLKN